MGKVFKAHDTAIDRDVAIKVLPTGLANEPGYRERFRREAHAAARLTNRTSSLFTISVKSTAVYTW